ncbi:hypothetical protein CK203_106041 [Vitis vinifera]|uniref:Uncharacterized protein n=1 Tax=Vitis vinifera TaxID=29760 RepID=A0A438C5R6_VITVI|nr:hypothetical protein CK203_106041 [Vitis vinifera]
MVSAKFRRHSRGLRNHFARTCYLRRAAKLASTLRFPASLSRYMSGNFRRKYTYCTKRLRNHFATKGRFRSILKMLPSAQSDWLAMAATSSFQLQIAHLPVLVQCPGLSGKEVAAIPPIVTPVTITEDPSSRMDRLEQRIRQMRDPDEMISWDDTDDVPMATLSVSFRMPNIERYTGVGCPRIHLRLYSTVMRALGLDEAQLLTLFPLSLSGITQRCRELEFLRQGLDESVSSFISRLREKAAEMIE